MKIRAVLIALMLAVGLAGCEVSEYVQDGVSDYANPFNQHVQIGQVKRFERAPETFLAGTTVVTDTLAHGTQIEYLAANGQSFLWYPGNQRPVRGAWSIDRAERSVCFRYGSNTVNPVTGLSGGGCDRIGSYFADVKVILEGDPFNLASGQVPFVMDRQRISRFPDLRVRAGLPPNYVNLMLTGRNS